MIESFKISLLVIFSMFQPAWRPADDVPESPHERGSRYGMISHVIATEALSDEVTPFNPIDDAALATAITRGESAYEYNVHAGRKSHIGTADNGRAMCLGQIHHVKAWWSEEEWKALAGLDEQSTRLCIRAIFKILAYHADRCKLRSKLPQKQRWKQPLSSIEARKLIRWYGKGNCGMGGMTKTTWWKSRKFFEVQRHLTLNVNK